jgi:hypothetical protein
MAYAERDALPVELRPSAHGGRLYGARLATAYSCGVRNAGVLAICAVVFGYASVVQGGGENQFAHLALVRSLADGTPIVDPYHRESKDLAWHEGHYYSTKAPGLAFLTVGPYFVLDRTGLLNASADALETDPRSVALWALVLIGVVLPAAMLLFLLRRVGDDVEPELGAVTAVTAGLCTLLFPFATVFFDHILAAALGFAAFALLFYVPDRLAMTLLAGLIAGLAITAEYPLGLVVLAVGAYALRDGDRLRRGACYATGVVVGVLPLLLYNWWAFGSPFHLSYENAIIEPGVSGHDVLGANDQGLYGVDVPQRGVAMQLLFSRIGLITVTPVVLAGAAGLVLLWRKGRRWEAGLAGFLVIAYVFYNSGYATPFGGGTPGPRFLIPMLPFVALGFATAYRAWPWQTIALAVPSGLIMLGVTATDPLRNVTWAWVDRIVDGTFAGSGVWPKLPLAASVIAAVALCVLATPIGRPTPAQAVGGALTLVLYITVAFSGPRLVGTTPELLLLLVAGCVLAVIASHQWLRPARHAPPPTRAQ